MANIEESRRQMTKTKEQLEEEKKISLSIRIKPLDLESLDSDGLRQKATDLWDTIIRLETEKYDIEEKQKRQNYDVSFFFFHFSNQKKMKCHSYNSNLKSYIFRKEICLQ